MNDITKKLNKIVLERKKKKIEYKEYHIKYLNPPNHYNYYEDILYEE